MPSQIESYMLLKITYEANVTKQSCKNQTQKIYKCKLRPLLSSSRQILMASTEMLSNKLTCVKSNELY